MYKNKEKIL